MRFIKRHLPWISPLALLFGSLTVFAGTYEWVPMGKSDLRVITDAKVEAEFRLDLIKNAEATLDLVTYDQRMDERVGMPLLEKLAEAAERGIKIRYAISATMLPLTDPMNHLGHYLKGITAKHPNFEFLFPGGASMMWHSGWGPLDGIHEKLLIVDGKIAFVTGRGHADTYLNWLDTAFVFKGPLVEQSNLAFEKLWATLHRELKLPQKDGNLPVQDPSGAKPTEFQTSKSPMELSESEQKEIDSLNEWRKLPSSNDTDYQARLIHHDFLDQMRATGRKPSSISMKERIEILNDSVVEEIVRKLPCSQTLNYCTLATILNPKLKQAFLTALTQADPLHLEVFTNSIAGHINISPFHLSAGWYAGIKDLDDLLETGHAKAFELHDPILQTPPLSPFIWLHRKLILIGAGEKSSVIFGSHNLTYASSVVLDEMSFEIESLDFYQEMLQLFNGNITSYGKEIPAASIKRDTKAKTFEQWFASNFSLMY